MKWVLLAAVLIVVLVILEGKRQERKYGRAGGRGGNLMRSGVLEFQRHLEPERKVEIPMERREPTLALESGDEPSKARKPTVGEGDDMPVSNAALARRWFEQVWNVRSEETVRELMAPVVEGHMEGGLEVRAPEDFLAARRGLLEAFPDFAVTVEDVIAEGDDVAVRWSARGTHRGESLGFPASNRSAAFRGITWLTFENGKIVKGWDAWNQGRLLQDLQAR